MHTHRGTWPLLALILAAGTAEAYTVEQGTLRDGNSQPLTLRGVNWFGFETSDHVVHGLWARNWKDMIAQIKAVGFNAVRIPVCPGTLAGSRVSSVNTTLNPDLAGRTSLEVLDRVLGEFDRQGLHILLDHHRLDCNGGISELWYDPGHGEQDWIDDLVFMARRYRNLPHFLGIDLKNEPHGTATWGLGRPATDWNSAAERAARAVLEAAPDILIFVEGIQDNPSCSGPVPHWWGGNLEPLACHPLAIPANRLVLSPHVYGPDVYDQPYFNATDFPRNLPAIWDAHFGRFRATGHVIAIGEAGGRYGHGGNPGDKTWQDAFIAYLGQRDIRHLFYWAWNPNSGDTGGILQDDWKTVWQDKLDLLGRLWGAAPPPPGPACADGQDNDGDGLVDHPADPGCTTPGDSDENDPPPPPAACQDGRDNDGDGRVDHPADPGCASPTDTDEYNPPPPPTELELPARISLGSDWGSGYCADGSVTNTSHDTVIWRASFPFQGRISQLWNARYQQQDGDRLTVAGLDWNRQLAPGASASFGFCAERPPSKPACRDGRDNDGDGKTDYPGDPGCSDSDDGDETDPGGTALDTRLLIRSDWGRGYCADVEVRNGSGQPVEWQVRLTIAGRIANLWNAIWTQTGSTLSARGLDWNRQVPANGKVGFGFCADR